MQQKIVVVGMPLPRSGRVRGWVHMDVPAFASGGERALSPAVVALGDAALTEMAPRAVKPALRGTRARVVIAAGLRPNSWRSGRGRSRRSFCRHRCSPTA